MTENEAIERIKKESCYSENCHDGCLYGEENCAYSKAISALEEIQQYREIGTVEECREARENAGRHYMIKVAFGGKIYEINV